MTTHYGVRELSEKDHPALTNYLANANRYSSLLMRAPAQDFSQAGGYWMGALAEGTRLEAVAYTEGLATNVCADEIAAGEALGRELKRRHQATRPLPGLRQIVGDERSVTAYYSIFQEANLKVMFDRNRHLFGAGVELTAPEVQLSFEPAGAQDFKAVYEFTALQATELWGIDPRRTTQQEAHERHCRLAIEQERQIIVRDGGRPVMVAEIVRPDDKTVMLDRIYVTVPYKVRKKLVTGALKGCARLAIGQAEEVLLFADANDKLINEACQSGGFAKMSTYRLIVMRV